MMGHCPHLVWAAQGTQATVSWDAPGELRIAAVNKAQVLPWDSHGLVARARGWDRGAAVAALSRSLTPPEGK